MSPGSGIFLISVFGFAAFALTWSGARQVTESKLQFLVANRKLGVWETAFSIAATWIWAPALFVSAEKAYTQGLAGVFWFTVPNVLCLIIFALFAQKFRKLAPDGFTLTDYMRKRYSRRVHFLYFLQMAGLAVCSFAVQLLAGGKVLAFLFNLNFFAVTVILAVVALSYSLCNGLKASVITDHAQMAIILGVTLLVVPWAIIKSGGLTTVVAGLGGRTQSYVNIFSGDGLSVAWSFGIPVTIGLLAGPFGDQSFWQRSFAIRASEVKGAFIRGALLFALIPVMLSLLGFVAAGMGWKVTDTALVNLDAVKRLLPQWVIVPFVFMLLSGLVSTLDSNLCAISSLCGHDLLQDHDHITPSRILEISRFSMVLLALAAVLIANIPGMKILYLFLFYGSLRASTLMPTVGTLLTKKIRESGVFFGILLSLAVGLPIFAYGNFAGHQNFATIGSILIIFISGFSVFGSSLFITSTSIKKSIFYRLSSKVFHRGYQKTRD